VALRRRREQDLPGPQEQGHRRDYGKLDLSLEDIVVVAMGNGELKIKLENSIKQLSEQISNLQWNEITTHIDESKAIRIARSSKFGTVLLVTGSARAGDRPRILGFI
jgi:hypothetical protein